MNNRERDRVAYELESTIDQYGLADVLQMIAEICYEKSDHVSTVWSDNALAKVWSGAAKRIETVSDRFYGSL